MSGPTKVYTCDRCGKEYRGLDRVPRPHWFAARPQGDPLECGHVWFLCGRCSTIVLGVLSDALEGSAAA